MLEIILVDYDSKNIARFNNNFKEVSKLLSDILNIEAKIFKSYETINGFHFYIYIKINNPKLKQLCNNIKFKHLLLTSLELLFLSDTKRAVFNILRIINLNVKSYQENISTFFRETQLKQIPINQIINNKNQ